MGDDRTPMARSLAGCKPAAEAAAAIFCPIDARQQYSQEAFRRLAEIHAVLHAVQRGTMCERRAIQEIEQIATGAAERIVRVGEGFQPDMATNREGDR